MYLSMRRELVRVWCVALVWRDEQVNVFDEDKVGQSECGQLIRWW